MRTTAFIASGVFLSMVCTLTGFLLPHASALPSVTLLLCSFTGVLCLGGILHFLLHGAE